jgi:aquaporin Z
MFVLIIALSTDKPAASGFAGIAIGLSLTLIHLISIPVTNTSVNPARSLGPAIYAGGDALGQVWFFFVMPIIGAVIRGLIYRYLSMTEPITAAWSLRAGRRVRGRGAL